VSEVGDICTREL